MGVLFRSVCIAQRNKPSETVFTKLGFFAVFCIFSSVNVHVSIKFLHKDLQRILTIVFAKFRLDTSPLSAFTAVFFLANPVLFFLISP